MIEQNGSDPMFEKANDKDDQDIIELTDEVAPEPMDDDEDIIELTSEVEESVGEGDDEEILELTSELDESAGEGDDEEILELTSELDEPVGEGDDEEILELTSEIDESVGMADEDEIIELTSETDEAVGQADRVFDAQTPDGIDARLDEAAPDAISETEEDEEDLLNFLSDEPETAMEPDPAPAIEKEIPEPASVDDIEFHEPAFMESQTELPRKDYELASVMGIELDPARDLSLEIKGDDIEVELDGLEKNESRGLPTFFIPRKQLEAAIERVVETKLSEKIDKLLTEAIEKAVTAEISRLKRLLIDDFPEK